ncbi:hypothetical protein [Desulfitobacterium sp. PCE1]|uniref:hypothetical protein n=1 Tax=Desulfitobacterium sp. PCE1 TaxID=146907 RepID=UPI000378B275|nr:hypothetical protein [Desulfitobacterium sp. PCE1]
MKSTKKIHLKKYMKYLGALIVIMAFIFMLEKLKTIDLDYSIFFNKKNLTIFFLLACFNTMLIIISYIPWMKIISIFSNERIPHTTIIYIFSKSNILKYIPGNIFQYIGRNQLAFETNVKHTDLAFATIFDVGLLVLSSFLVSIFFLGEDAIHYIIQNGRISYWVILLSILISIAFTLIAYRYREKVIESLRKYVGIINLKNFLKILFCITYYLIYLMFFVGIYLIILVFILKQEISFQLYLDLIGAFNLSWVIGFIAPGAPGGIGVREAVMTLIAGGLISSEVIIISMVIFRFINLLADLGAFLIAYFIISLTKFYRN